MRALERGREVRRAGAVGARKHEAARDLVLPTPWSQVDQRPGRPRKCGSPRNGGSMNVLAALEAAPPGEADVLEAGLLAERLGLPVPPPQRARAPLDDLVVDRRREPVLERPVVEIVARRPLLECGRNAGQPSGGTSVTAGASSGPDGSCHCRVSSALTACTMRETHRLRSRLSTRSAHSPATFTRQSPARFLCER